MQGTVVGPSLTEGKVSVKFESPGGRWDMRPSVISTTKLMPEDIVCLHGMGSLPTYAVSHECRNEHSTLIISIVPNVEDKFYT